MIGVMDVQLFYKGYIGNCYLGFRVASKDSRIGSFLGTSAMHLVPQSLSQVTAPMERRRTSFCIEAFPRTALHLESP